MPSTSLNTEMVLYLNVRKKQHSSIRFRQLIEQYLFYNSGSIYMSLIRVFSALKLSDKPYLRAQNWG